MDYKRDLDRKAADYDVAKEKQRLAGEMARWEKRAEQAKANGARPPRKPQLQVHPHQWQNYPANLYNAMIHPLVPFAMRGAIWYQGEANTHSIEEAVRYYDLLTAMVKSWRKDWNADFPFYAVQLPNYLQPQADPVQDAGWPYIREGFLRFHQADNQGWMAVTIDAGEANNIHPADKQTVGYRLARQALVHTYHQGGVAGGPIYKGLRIESDKVILSFEEVGSGLVAKEGRPLAAFAIAGSDRRFVPAEAAVHGNTVRVWSPRIQSPQAVRYAWANNPEGCNLCNCEGFPASPFRTDDWPPAPAPGQPRE
jgi:sialate O-acetylesterase